MILYIPAARANSLNRTGDLWISPLLYQLSYIGYKNSRRRSTRVRVCTGSWGLSTPLPRTGSGLRFLGSWLLYLLPDTSMQTIQEISCMKQVGMDSNHYRRFWRPQFCLWTTNPWDRQAAKILDKTKKNRDKIMQSYISTVTCRLSVLLIICKKTYFFSRRFVQHGRDFFVFSWIVKMILHCDEYIGYNK